MTSSRSSRPPLLLAGAVLAASLPAAVGAMPAPVRLLLPPLTALALARRLMRDREAARTIETLRAEAAAAEVRIARLTESASEMRHDLRGILSPALLTADRLAMSQDPASRRAGEAMISTVERAEARLRAG